MRIICRRYFWTNQLQYPYRRVYKEGLRLISLHWEGTRFTSKVLDEFTVPTPDSTGILYTGGLLPSPSGKNYFICATMIKGTTQHNDVGVYDISNDRLTKLYSTQIDSISTIGILQYSIDNDTTPDWCVRNFQKNGYSPIKFYSGNIQNNVEVIGKYSICQRTFLSSALLGGGSLQHGVALSGNDGSCFRIVTLNDLLKVEGKEVEKLSPFSIESITPQPVNNKQTIQVKLSIPIQAMYEVSIYSLNGNKLHSFTNGQSVNEQQTLTISLSEYNLPNGFYWLTLKVGKQETHTKLIVN